ncbi:MAG: hypothetical protein LUF90_06690 [Rikenellaceae bacterium]|nr:hypothetical protein [Rikenellaceae bacterium]
MPAESLIILDGNGESVYEIEVDMMFYQPKKSYWWQRANISIPYDILVELYKNQTPYSIVLHGKDETITYRISRGKWEKQSAVINKVFNVIQYNE